MEVKLLDLQQQYQSIKDEVLEEIAAVCDSQIFALGPKVQQLEKHMANYCRVKEAIGVSSGTDALLASLMALNIGTGDEVITTTFSFFATAGVISRLGAKPVFVDIDPETFNIDPEQTKQAINTKTKAIIPVHLYGQIADMQTLQQAAGEIPIIEDACQAIGAEQNGKKAGAFGAFGCFSFYPTKNLGGFGDGGLITTNDEELANRVRLMRTHGESPRYYYRMVGGNFRLDALQAAVLNVKLNHLDTWNQKRQTNASMYNKLLNDCSDVRTPIIAKGNTHIYHQYTILAENRDALMEHLQKTNIGCAVFYPLPLHLQDCFAPLGYKQGQLPVAEETAQKVLSLPIYPELKPEQIEYAAKTICEFYA